LAPFGAGAGLPRRGYSGQPRLGQVRYASHSPLFAERQERGFGHRAHHWRAAARPVSCPRTTNSAEMLNSTSTIEGPQQAWNRMAQRYIRRNHADGCDPIPNLAADFGAAIAVVEHDAIDEFRATGVANLLIPEKSDAVTVALPGLARMRPDRFRLLRASSIVERQVQATAIAQRPGERRLTRAACPTRRTTGVSRRASTSRPRTKRSYKRISPAAPDN
jgi:hypothetical protein